MPVLVAIDGSISSNNALRQVICFSRDAQWSVSAVAVVPRSEGGLSPSAIRNVNDSSVEPGNTVLSDARSIAEEHGVELHTFVAEGNAHEAIVDAALDQDCDLIVVGRRGLTRLERVFMGNVTARVIGYSPIDVLVMPYDSELKWDNILVAVDGSECSHVAASTAIEFAQSYGKKLNILSVVDVPVEAYADAADVVDRLVLRSRELVDAVAILASAAGLEAETFIRVGPTHEKILALADETHAGVIAMGSHGRTGLKRFLMGSVAERVIGNATCPVLVVRRH